MTEAPAREETARLSMCEGKQRFTDAARAKMVTRAMNRRPGRHANPYRCRHCGGWHVGWRA
jgi:hypothetical protein